MMVALPIRKKIEAELDALSDEQAAAVLEFIQTVKQEPSVTDGDEDDPLVGFISGPTDVAERTREILKAEFGVTNSEGDDPA